MRLRPLAACLSASILCAAVLASPAARAQEPAPYAPPVPAQAPPPAAPDASEEVLRRILASGCRDGLPEAQALAARGGTAWAETVSRLCGELLTAPQPEVPPLKLVAPRERGERDGRAAIVIGSSAYGIWLGVAVDVLFGNDDVRGAIIPPLLGMGAGLAISLLATANHPIDGGQSWAIITGMEYGSINGALWAGGLDLDSEEVVGTALATGLGSSAVGLLVAEKLHPGQGDVEVVRSGLLWGTVTGLLAMAAISPDSDETSFFRVGAISMNLGFLGGLALAASFDVSRNRDLVIDAGALGGGFVGLGVSWLATAGPQGPNGRALAGGTIAGLYAGMILAAALTREMDDDPADKDDAPVAALIGRDRRGRWKLGTPGPAPVMDGTGRRAIGATFTALGGSF
jgi:hypothetical protein